MLIALSGGADSVALLLMMLEQGKVSAAAHCNFHLRGDESNRDEQFVRKLCAERGVTLYVTHFDTRAEAERTGESIEMAARRLRYDWFAELCETHHIAEVAVAHHRDDNAETVLLNLIRGTGLRGLCGMSAERTGVVRPLLSLSRREILAYLKEKGQTYVTDSTNTDTHYRRNKIRHEVLPLLRTMNGRIDDTLNETAKRLSQVEKIYLYGVQMLRKQIVTDLDGHGGICIDFGRLEKAPSPRCLLYEWLSPYGFTTAQIDEAFAMRVGGMLETSDYVLTRTSQSVMVQHWPEEVKPIAIPDEDGHFAILNGRTYGVERMRRADLALIPREPYRVALDADQLHGQLFLRSVCPADRFRPLGMKGTKLVSDFQTDRHYSRIDKMASLVVTDEKGIVWLVGERIDARVALTPETQRVLLIYSEK